MLCKKTFCSLRVSARSGNKFFLSAEDKNFFNHPGIDAKGILRALINNIRNISQNKRLEGASTITQQVAKNFLLTNEVSLKRKVKEAF